MNLAVIGATGLVGEEILKVLQEKKIKINELTLVAVSYTHLTLPTTPYV